MRALPIYGFPISVKNSLAIAGSLFAINDQNPVRVLPQTKKFLMIASKGKKVNRKISAGKTFFQSTG
jgi:hypothetical protein